jgi:hypothetical protein
VADWTQTLTLKNWPITFAGRFASKAEAMDVYERMVAARHALGAWDTAVEAIRKQQPSQLAECIAQHPTLLQQQDVNDGNSLLHMAGTVSSLCSCRFSDL